MVELGFGGSVGLGFNSGDVRSVIKNATKDPKMSESKDKTILNKDEIEAKKMSKTIKPKVQPSVGSQIGGIPGVGSISINKPQKTTQSTTPTTQIGENIGTNIGGIPGVGDISGIKVANVGGTQNVGGVNNDKKLINGRGRMTALKDVVDVDSAIEDLYMDVGVGFRNGTLADTDVNAIKQAYSEFAGLDDNVIMDLIADLGSLYQKGLSLNETNLAKLKEGYPELKSVGRGFATPEEQNMYQGGGFRETINQGTPTDLNKYGAAGKVAETVVNPLGQATTALDAAAQQLPQVTGAKMEKKLKDKLSSLTDEQIDRYYQRYKDLVSQGKLKGYTTRVEGKNAVAQMWNAIFGGKSGKKYQDVEGGFRQWLIDQVDADVNGFAGALFDTNYFDQNVGPNTGKLLANIPASAVKTVTAITRAMTNPLDTLSGLTTLLFTEQGHEALKARYGSWEAITKTMEQDPVGLASDVLAVAEGGAGLAKGGVKLGKLGTKGASLATYVLGVEKTSEGLLKIANRLERLEGKIGGFKTMAGEASDMGMRRFIYGEELSNGVRRGGLINALEQRASEGDNLTNKAAGYLAKTQQPLKTAGEVVRKTKEAGGVTGRIAQKITGSATAEDKLFQAASPNINKLTRGVDYKNKRANMDLANKAIIEAGYTPKSTAERVVAHLETLNKRWKEFTDKVKGKADVDVSSERLAKVLEDHINAAGKNITENQRSDINALQKEIKSLKGRERFNMIDLEDYKENINADIRNKTQTAKSDIYIRGMKKLSEEIGKIQNEILSNAPDEVKNLKRTIGALLDTKDDVIKANVKNLKKKEGGGLVESYSRIQGVADIVGGGLSILSRGGEGVKDVAKGVGKVVLGKALGKAKDVDWLTKQGFEGLRKKYEGKRLEGGKIEGKSVETKGAKAKKGEKGLKFQKGEEGDYDKALSVAYRKGERKNKVLSESEQKRVKGEIEKKAKNAGFVTKLFDNMVDAVKKSGGEAKEGDIIHGFTNIKDKIIALSKNPLDTTAQHELFHAVFDVVDKKSKGVVLGEAKKFLEEKLGKVVSDSVAEEWLAESFGIYMRDKMIDLGIIDKAKGIIGLKQKVERLFQRGYEWMQNYNADRFLINDFFNAMWEGKGLNKKGTLDLSYLWKDKGVSVKGTTKKGGSVKMQKGLVQKGNKLYVETPYGMRSAGVPEDALSVKEYKEGFSSKGLQDKIKNIDKASVSKLLDNNDIAGAVKKINSSNGKKLFDLGDDNKLYMNTSYGPQVVSVSNTKQGVKNYLMGFMDQITDKKWRDQGLKFQKDSDGRNLSEGQIQKFKNSKIRDDKGNLLRVYHGTPEQDFFIFSDDAVGNNMGNEGFFGRGFSFTQGKKTAEGYQHGFYGDKPGRLLEGYLDIRNPFEWDDIKSAADVKKLEDKLGLERGTLKWDKDLEMLASWDEGSNYSNKISAGEFSNALKKAGYDGIIKRGDWDGFGDIPENGMGEIVAFNSNQFKLADNKNPTESLDIRFQKDNNGRQLSKGQQKYFKDSKIRSNNGKLLRAYHATFSKFNKFSREKIGKVSGNKGIYGEGFYFSTNKEQLKDSKWMRRGGKMMEGYLNIKNPFVWDNIKSQGELDKLLGDLGLEKGFLEYDKDIFGDERVLPMFDDKKSIRFREALENNGYDGVWVKYSDGEDEVVAFNSEQFKNLDNLNPTKNEDIRFQTEGGKGLTPKKKTSKTTSNKYLKGLALRGGMRYKEEK